MKVKIKLNGEWYRNRAKKWYELIDYEESSIAMIAKDNLVSKTCVRENINAYINLLVKEEPVTPLQREWNKFL